MLCTEISYHPDYESMNRHGIAARAMLVVAADASAGAGSSLNRATAAKPKTIVSVRNLVDGLKLLGRSDTIKAF